MNNVLVVANFSAGRKQAIKYRRKLQKFLFQKQVNFHFVTIDQLNEIEVEAFDTILVVGGDGTVNKVLPYLVNTTKTLGIIPCGTANLLAANLGIHSISKALRVIDRGHFKQIDIMTINKNLSVLRFGIGYDADIIGKTPQSLKNRFGYFAYFVLGITFALRLKKKEYLITLNNEERSIQASCIIVANVANMYRNLFSIAKDSRLEDGFLDIFILKTQNPILLCFECIKILFNMKRNSFVAEYHKVRNCKIKNKYCVAHIDGEKIKLTEDISCNVIVNSINIFS